MRRNTTIRNTTIRCTMLLVLALMCWTNTINNACGAIITALTSSNSLVNFDSSAPGTILNTVSVTGLTVGDSLVGIDYRPSDGQLIGFGYNSAAGTARVYSINIFGVATSINANPLNVGVGVGRITADFNPTANALRVVTSAATGNNLRLPAGGTGVLTLDTDLNPANSTIRATAYSRNTAGGGTSGATTLYAIDGANNRLASQGSVDFFTGNGTSPNTGTLAGIATLNGVSATTIVGFDIFNALGTSPTSPGDAFVATTSQLFSLNLTNGTATLLGNIGQGLEVFDIAAVAVPEPTSLMLCGLVSLGLACASRRRRNRK